MYTALGSRACCGSFCLAGSPEVPRAVPRAAQKARLGVEKVQNTAPPTWVVAFVYACSGSDQPHTLTKGSLVARICHYSKVSTHLTRK